MMLSLLLVASLCQVPSITPICEDRLDNKIVMSLAFDSTGKQCVYGGSDGTIIVYDLVDKKVASRIEIGKKKDISFVDFWPDDSTLLVAGMAYTLFLWDLNKQEKLFDFQSPVSTYSAAITRDAKLLATSSPSGKCLIWDLEKRRLKTELVPDQLNVKTAFGPNIDWVAVSPLADKLTEIWEIKSRKKIKELGGHTKRVRGISVSPDNSLMATGSLDGSVILWSAKDLQMKKKLENQKAPIGDVVFSPDSKLLASFAGNGTVRLWQVLSGKLLAEGRVHSAAIWCGGFSRDGKMLAIGGVEGTFRVFQVADILKAIQQSNP